MIDGGIQEAGLQRVLQHLESSLTPEALPKDGVAGLYARLYAQTGVGIDAEIPDREPALPGFIQDPSTAKQFFTSSRPRRNEAQAIMEDGVLERRQECVNAVMGELRNRLGMVGAKALQQLDEANLAGNPKNLDIAQTATALACVLNGIAEGKVNFVRNLAEAYEHTKEGDTTFVFQGHFDSDQGQQFDVKVFIRPNTYIRKHISQAAHSEDSLEVQENTEVREAQTTIVVTSPSLPNGEARISIAAQADEQSETEKHRVKFSIDLDQTAHDSFLSTLELENYGVDLTVFHRIFTNVILAYSSGSKIPVAAGMKETKKEAQQRREVAKRAKQQAHLARIAAQVEAKRIRKAARMAEIASARKAAEAKKRKKKEEAKAALTAALNDAQRVGLEEAKLEAGRKKQALLDRIFALTGVGANASENSSVGMPPFIQDAEMARRWFSDHDEQTGRVENVDVETLEQRRDCINTVINNLRTQLGMIGTRALEQIPAVERTSSIERLSLIAQTVTEMAYVLNDISRGRIKFARNVRSEELSRKKGDETYVFEGTVTSDTDEGMGVKVFIRPVTYREETKQASRNADSPNTTFRQTFYREARTLIEIKSPMISRGRAIIRIDPTHEDRVADDGEIVFDVVVGSKSGAWMKLLDAEDIGQYMGHHFMSNTNLGEFGMTIEDFHRIIAYQLNSYANATLLDFAADAERQAELNDQEAA